MTVKTWTGVALGIALSAMTLAFASESPATTSSSTQQTNMFIQRLDKDGDGKVSQQEMLQHFDELDADEDGYIDASEAPKGPPHHHGRMHRDFIKDFDKDGDGKVSNEEFPGPDGHFTRLDTNGDGYIDETEAPKGPPM